jgi:hypothetical protein
MDLDVFEECMKTYLRGKVGTVEKSKSLSDL